MTLGERQRDFPPMVAALITWAYNNGFKITFGEAYRTPEQAALNASRGTGIANSLHTQRLAIDLNLFKDGVFLGDPSIPAATVIENYRPLGEYWESLGGSWGARFNKPDVDHFSLQWEGVR